MNRCIQCYRCVRFYRDYAGGRDFAVLGWHDDVYFGRHEDGPLESEFSGNLVEVCPTGVFTDKTLKEHYTRKWDLQTAPSVCVHCGLGCNTIPGERYGMLRRIRNRYNGQVNGYFLCDRGRYGYEFVNSDRRVPQAIRRGEPMAGRRRSPRTRPCVRRPTGSRHRGGPWASGRRGRRWRPTSPCARWSAPSGSRWACRRPMRAWHTWPPTSCAAALRGPPPWLTRPPPTPSSSWART